MAPRLIIICGATATGKTDCAIKIAKRIDGEIINADSMQVYRFLSIGTAKPTKTEQALVPFHIIDVADPDQTFSAGLFCKLARRTIEEIFSRKKNVVVAGGTGLYLKALVQGIFEGPKADQELRDKMTEMEKKEPGSLYARLLEVDPDKGAQLPPADLGRIIRALEVYEKTGKPISLLQKEHGFSQEKYKTLWIGLSPEREKLYSRINDRVVEMMDRGWINEVSELKSMGFGKKGAAANALGYRTILAYLDVGLEIEKVIKTIQQETRKFAKRQLTWFRANNLVSETLKNDQLEEESKGAK